MVVTYGYFLVVDAPSYACHRTALGVWWNTCGENRYALVTATHSRLSGASGALVVVPGLDECHGSELTLLSSHPTVHGGIINTITDEKQLGVYNAKI